MLHTLRSLGWTGRTGRRRNEGSLRTRAGRLEGQRLRPGWITPTVEGRIGVPTRRLLVAHTPKTGGSSLRKMLAAHVPPEQTFLSTGKHQWADSSFGELRSKTLFVGHSFLEPLYLLPHDHWVVVIAVRDPLDWWRSWYKYSRRVAVNEGRLDDPILQVSMSEWLARCSDVELSNPQSSWLLTRARVAFDSPWAPTSRPVSTGISLTRTPEACAQMIEGLLSRSVVGVTDDLYGLYRATCRAMGWAPRHEQAVVDNVTSADPALLELTDADVRRLRRLSVLDQYAYDLARRAATTVAA